MEIGQVISVGSLRGSRKMARFDDGNDNDAFV